MKVAVSIPDDVFARADRMAQELGTTRSGLYGRALKAFLQSMEIDRTCEALDAVFDAVGDENPGFVRQAARQRLARTEW